MGVHRRREPGGRGGVLQHPGVFGAPAETRGGKGLPLRGQAGQGAGGDGVIVGAAAQGEEQVVLVTLHAAAPLVADGPGAGLGALGDEPLRRAADLLAQRALPRHGPLADEGQDAVRGEIGHHHFPLVQVAQPERRHRAQDRRLAGVEADDLVGVGQERAVVGQPCAEPVDQGHGFLAQTMDQPRYAQQRAALEDQGVEQPVGDAVEHDVDALQAGDRLQVEAIVQHEQVPALDERHAHAPGQEAVLGVERVQRPRREQDDGGFRPRRLVAVGRVVGEVGGRLAQGFQQQGRRLGQGSHGVALEQLRGHPGQDAAVLDHARQAVGLREVVRGDEQFPAGVPAHVHGPGVQEGAQRWHQPDRGPLEGGAAEHQRDGHDPGAQDLLLAHVDVLQKALERSQPLPQPPGEPIPVLVGKQLRQSVAQPGLLRGERAPRRGVERHAQLAHGRLQPLVQRAAVRGG